MEIVRLASHTLLVAAPGEPPLVVLGAGEAPRFGRWADGAVIVLTAARESLIAEATVLLDVARPRLVALATPRMPWGGKRVAATSILAWAALSTMGMSSERKPISRYCLMRTGSSLMFSVQAASQGAGHTRPVISGKLLVECRFSAASRQRPR